MAININKKDLSGPSLNKEDLDYYYEQNDNSVGPFKLSELIKYINENSLVYSEKTGWKVAKEIPEIKNLLDINNLQKPNPISNDSYQYDSENSKSKRTPWWLLATVLIIAGAFYYINYKSKDPIGLTTNELKPLVDSTVLKESDIFNFRKVKKYKSSIDQQAQAEYYLNAGMDSLNRASNISAVDVLIKSVRCNPVNSTYFNLGRAYLNCNKFSESEQCFKMASRLKYKPKADISIFLAKIYAATQNEKLLMRELSTLKIINIGQYDSLTSDPAIAVYLSNNDTSSHFTDEPISEEVIAVDDENIHIDIVKQYFSDLNNKSFEVYNYFSNHIDQYCLLENTNQQEVQRSLKSNSEFVNPYSELLMDRIVAVDDNTVEAWIKFSCYRNSKMKFQSCLVKTQFIFDESNKIKSYRELEIKNLKFTNKPN
jgi:hypothetical protein